MSRRLSRLLVTLSLALVLPMTLAAQADPALAHARRLLESTILIDGHNDLPWEIRKADRDVVARTTCARPHPA
jgi:membrane dipeptidase